MVRPWLGFRASWEFRIGASGSRGAKFGVLGQKEVFLRRRSGGEESLSKRGPWAEFGERFLPRHLALSSSPVRLPKRGESLAVAQRC